LFSNSAQFDWSSCGVKIRVATSLARSIRVLVCCCDCREISGPSAFFIARIAPVHGACCRFQVVQKHVVAFVLDYDAPIRCAALSRETESGFRDFACGAFQIAVAPDNRRVVTA
jgi:hypothetical protein